MPGKLCGLRCRVPCTMYHPADGWTTDHGRTMVRTIGQQVHTRGFDPRSCATVIRLLATKLLDLYFLDSASNTDINYIYTDINYNLL